MATGNPGNVDMPLTPPEVIATAAPFVEHVWVQDDPDDQSEDSPAASLPNKPVIKGHFERRVKSGDMIYMSSCSEFMLHHEPLSMFAANPSVNGHRSSSFRMVHDPAGQHLVFTVSNSGNLYCLTHVNGAVGSWQAANITPTVVLDKKTFVSAFDVLQVGSLIHMVLCADGTLYHSTTTLDILQHVTEPQTVHGFGCGSASWTPIVNNLGEKSVSTIRCCPSANKSGYRLVVGTTEDSASGLASTYYIVDPSSNKVDSPWQAYFLPESANDVLALEPAVTGYSALPEGVFALYVQSDGNHKVSLSGSTIESKQTEDFMISTFKMGHVQDIFASVNPWGKTDLFLAGQGIGFVEAGRPEQKPAILLPDISFAKVVASEKGVGAKSTRISVFALSNTNDLYFVEGHRTLGQKNESTVTFPIVSGFPIRKGVTQVSPMFNKSVRATEVLYTSNENDNMLRHLVRDPNTSMWNETALRVAMADCKDTASDASQPITQSVSYHAYVTTITFADKDGTSVGPDYPVQFSCEAPVLVTINGCSYNLSSKPQQVLTSSTGQLEVVMRVHGLLGCPQYSVSLTEFCIEAQRAASFKIQPAQRVMRRLGQIKTADDLKNAKQTNGKPVFADSSAQSGDFDSMAAMLKQFPDMISSVNKGTGDGDDSSMEQVDYVINDKGVLQKYQPKPEQPSMLDKAVEVVGDAMGDVIEMMEKGIKTVVRVVFRVAGPVLRLFLELGDAVITFVIKTAVALLRTVASFLKKTFGLDLAKLCGFLGFVFDIEGIKSIQKELDATMSGILTAAKTAIPAVGTVIEKSIDSLEERVNDFLGVKPEKQASKKPTLPLWLTRLFNNPIIRAVLKFNPLAWIMEVVSEELEDLGISLPTTGLSQMFAEFEQALTDWVVQTSGHLVELISDVVANISQVFANPLQALGTMQSLLKSLIGFIFDAVRDVINLALDTLLALTNGIDDLIHGKWKVPLLTAAWRALADQDLTIMNFATFLVANFLNIVTAPLGGTDLVIFKLRSLQEGLKLFASSDDLEESISRAFLGSTASEDHHPHQNVVKPSAADVSVFAVFDGPTPSLASSETREPELSSTTMEHFQQPFSDKPAPSDKTESSDVVARRLYQLCLFFATVSRVAHTWLTTLPGVDNNDEEESSAPEQQHDVPAATGISVEVEMTVPSSWEKPNYVTMSLGDAVECGMMPLLSKEHFEANENLANINATESVLPKGCAATLLGLLKKFKRGLSVLLGALPAFFEVAALVCYHRINNLPESEKVTTNTAIIIDLVGWVAVLVGALFSREWWSRLGATVLRISQIATGFCRELLPLRYGEKSDWRMVTVGFINLLQGACGCVVLYNPSPDHRIFLLCMDGGLVGIAGVLNWLAS